MNDANAPGDKGVAEPPANLVEIRKRVHVCVVPRISRRAAEFSETGASIPEIDIRTPVDPRHLVRRVEALQGSRRTRSTKVDQHDGACAPDLLEVAGRHGGEGPRALPGAAGQDKQRIRLYRSAQRRQDSNVNRDLRAGSGPSVREHLVNATQNLLGELVDVARPEVEGTD